MVNLSYPNHMTKIQDSNHLLLDERISKLLKSLLQGYSRVSSTAYDTTWTARLVRYYPNKGFEASLKWLRDNQFEDGSWGSPIFHCHDRIVSTLAAIVALKEIGEEEDAQRIKSGQHFLWHNSPRLHHDANDTIAFPIIIVALTQQAEALGLDIPSNLYRDVSKIEKKLNMLNVHPEMWRATTLHHSLEAIIKYLPVGVDLDFGDETGCVGCSPSATASAMMNPQTSTQKSMDYLLKIIQHQGDGGAPNVDRIDVVEGAWAINNLLKDKLVQPDQPEVRRILDALWDIWSPEVGVSFSSSFGVPDLDDTSVAFTVLRWGGYPADLNIFEGYESEDHFNCFRGELDPSLSAHIRMLVALQWAKDAPQYERWNEKVIKLLRHYDLNGYFWFDKWHASPYYLTAPSVWLLHGIVDDLLSPRIKWITKTQQADGGWGFYDFSTVEETAYCLQALMYADEHIQPVDRSIIEAGANFFLSHLDKAEHPPLWIGKGLYTPEFVVESSMIATLHGLSNYL